MLMLGRGKYPFELQKLLNIMTKIITSMFQVDLHLCLREHYNCNKYNYNKLYCLENMNK